MELKDHRRWADVPSVKFERLVIESGDNCVAFDLNPRLTVISGLSQMERDGLINEFIGALGSSRSGVHLELSADNGGRFAVFRPNAAPHRVVDVDARMDVTTQFSDERGSINLLGRAGLDSRTARRAMRFNAQDLLEATDRDRIIGDLAKLDQRELWVAAEALRSAEQRMQDEADATGSTVEDAAVIETIEKNHADFERRQDENEQVRRATFLISGFAALMSVPLARVTSTFAVLPFGLIAMIAVIVSIVYWRRMEAAKRAEEEALAQAGAQSYLGFHLQRVNSLLSSDSNRRRLIIAAEEQRDALARWRAIAGDVDVDWALANQNEISRLTKLRETMNPSMGHASDETDSDHTATVAHAIIGRLGELRQLGSTGESFPALLDDPFTNVDQSVIPALLEIMVRSSEHQQIVLLTESSAVTSWAQIESMTGSVGLLEPTPAARAATSSF